MMFDRDKFRELVHFLCSFCDPDKFGKTKLHKILFFSDMEHFVQTGSPLTGEVYVKKQFGPIASHLDEITSELQREGRLQLEEEEWEGGDGKRWVFTALGDTDLSTFTPKQIALVSRFAVKFTHEYTAKQLSDKSHGLLWRITPSGHPLPYKVAYDLDSVPVTTEDIEWARQSLARGSA